MLVNFLSLCSVSSMRSGTRHWTSLRCSRRRDSREYGVLTEGQPEASRITVTIRLPKLSQHRPHALFRSAGQEIFCVAPLPSSFCSPPLTPVDEVARVTLNLYPASTGPANKSRSGFATTSFQLTAKRIEVHQHPGSSFLCARGTQLSRA